MILIHHRNNFIYHNQPAISCLTDNSNFYSQTNGYSDSTWYDPMGGRVSDLYVYSYNFSLLQQQCFVQYNHSQYSFSITLPRLVYTLGESYTGSESCSGLYHCLIPDRHGELQQLFLGIYSDTGSNIRKHRSKLNNNNNIINNDEANINFDNIYDNIIIYCKLFYS